jgi:hypothetical protein
MVRQVRLDVPVFGSNERFSASLLHGTLRPDGEPLRVKSLSPLCRTTLFTFSLVFLSFVLFFLAFHVHLSFCDFSPPQLCFSTLFFCPFLVFMLKIVDF